MSVAASTAIALGVAAGTAGAGIYGAKKSADAANNAAGIQGQSADKALAFQEQQAQLDAQRYEATQKANYAQYVNRVKGAQALGAKYGFNSIPDPAAYVPTPMGGPSGQQAPQVAPSPFGPRAIGNYLPRAN